MNVSSSAAVSTVVPQATAAGSGQSWAVSKESENWAGDKPAPEPASQRVDIKV
jgi:hypothetical protein